MSAPERPPVFEIRAELEEGFTIPGGRPWSGIRVQYRPIGSRGRWRRFLLEADQTPTIAQLQEIAAVHARGGRVKGG
ncbi:MAG: hypothetical protein ACREK4_20675 [Candidatus Rokuibacteriota bacterium]